MALWERQPCDTEESFKSFVSYRDQFRRPRGLPAGNGQRYMVVRRWCEEHNWKERAEAYDNYRDEMLRESRERAALERDAVVSEQVRGLLDDGREILAREIERIAGQARKDTDIPGVVKFGDLMKLADLILKWEAILAGRPTEHVRSEVDLSGMSPEDRRQLVELLGQASK